MLSDPINHQDTKTRRTLRNENNRRDAEDTEGGGTRGWGDAETRRQEREHKNFFLLVFSVFSAPLR